MIVKRLGPVAYDLTLRGDARLHRGARRRRRADEIWLCEHPPVFTQGIAGQAEHVLDAGDDPGRATNRGGQVTYHGPGQVVAYPLVDLRRLGIYVKEYVFRLEQALLKTLEAHGVTGHRVRGEPGIYVRLDDPFGHAALPRRPADAGDPFDGLGKIAALGVKVSNHCTYHGVALNVAMDLRPFERINPCGHAGLQTVDLSTLGVRACVGRGGRDPRRQARRLPEPAMTPSADLRRDRQAEGRGQDLAHPDQDRAGRRGAEEARLDPRQGRLAERPASTRSSRSCASTSCTRCARKRPARTSASASARARRRS